MPKNDRSLQAKETALLALAQGDPDFPAFLDRYRQALPQVAALPAELVEELMAAVEEDPALRLRRRSWGRPCTRASWSCAGRRDSRPSMEFLARIWRWPPSMTGPSHCCWTQTS